MEDYLNKYAAVADLYDSYVTTDYDLEFWLSECKDANEVLELTCGTGRLTIPLARSGIAITGRDISRQFVKQLKRKAKQERLKITAIESDMRYFSLNRKFDLIIIPFQSLQELINSKDHEACFQQVFKHLAKRGRFVITMHNISLLDQSNLNVLKFMGEFTNPKTKNQILFSMSRTFDSANHMGTCYQFYDEFNKNNTLASRKLFRNRHYAFAKGEPESLIRKTGFKIRNIWGDYAKGKYTENSQFRIYDLVKRTD